MMYFHFRMYTCLYSPSLLQTQIFDFLLLVAGIYTANIGFYPAVSHLYLYYERVLIIELYITRLGLYYINSLCVSGVLSTLSKLLLICLFFIFHLVDIKKLTFIDSVLLMQGFPWIILPVILTQGSAFFLEHYSLPYKFWQPSALSLPSYNPYLALFYNIGIHFDASLLQSIEFLFPVGL